MKNTCYTKLLIGGENLNLDLLKKLVQKFPEVVNLYGPTEATIWASSKIYTKEDEILKMVRSNIGCALPSKTIYILNDFLIPLPTYAQGNLYIGGADLARSYLNRPQLTEKLFIHKPFKKSSNEFLTKENRIYNTGDLARILSDGTIEYIGRSDRQVKINGNRIELSEIECAISKFKGIDSVVVLLKEKNQKHYLVAYYKASIKYDENKILEYLTKKLPSNMLPKFFMQVDEIPFTLNGKIDVKKLSELETENIKVKVDDKGDIEFVICKILANILDVQENMINLDDNFFKLGLNSLLSITLINRIRNDMNISLSITDIFLHNNVRKITRHLLKNQVPGQFELKLLKIKDNKYPLSFAQERLWYIEQLEGGTNFYNIPIIFSIKDNVNLDILLKSIKDIVYRHEVLRTTIGEDYKKFELFQNIEKPKNIEFLITKKNVASFSILDAEVSKDINYIFDLSRQIPIKIFIYELFNKKLYISIIIHHIAFDGWSSDIFLRELVEHYEHNILSGKKSEINLPKLKFHYKDYAAWQKNYIASDRLQNQISYWKKKLHAYEDLPRPFLQNHFQFDYKGDEVYFELEEDISSSLREIAKELGVSLFSLLVSSYFLMLHIHIKQKDIVIGTPVSNRHYPELESIIGFFVNMLPLRAKIKRDKSVSKFIQEISKDVVKMQIMQDVPFEKIVHELGIKSDMSKNPIFQVMFAVQNFSKEVRSKENKNMVLESLVEPYSSKNIKYKIARFDISTFVNDNSSKIDGVFNYATSIYDEVKINDMILCYKNILKELTRTFNCNKSISHFCLTC